MLVLKPSISHFSESCFPFLSCCLIGEEYKQKILSLCESLSGKWNTSQIGFECSLSESTNWADFHCLLDVHQLDEHTYENNLKNWNFEDPTWTLMGELFHKWSKEGFLEKHKIGRVILELDVGSSSLWPPKPNVCLVFTEQTDPLSAISDVWSALEGKNKTDLCLRTVEKILADGGEIRGMGLMLARLHALRVLSHNSNFNMLPTYLHGSHAWDSAKYLLEKVDSLPNNFSFFEVDIHENGKISPKIGLNILPKSETLSLESVFEKLCANHALTKEKRDALLSWIGKHYKADPHTGHTFSIMRSIHHFKFVSSPSKEISLKAYLAGHAAYTIEHLFSGSRQTASIMK